MKRQYIKFQEGSKKSLQRACKLAEDNGYKKDISTNSLYLKGSGILALDGYGDYYICFDTEQELIDIGYTELKEKIKEPEFKIGDTVKVINMNFDMYGIEDESLKSVILNRINYLDKEFKIQNIYNDNNSNLFNYCLSENGEYINELFQIQNLELVNKRETITIGDNVYDKDEYDNAIKKLVPIKK